MRATIYYDGDCPFCSKYTSLLRLKDSVESLSLVNVRDDTAVAEMLRVAGFDLDQGMLLDLDGNRFWGADAIHKLALMSTSFGWFNRANARIFGYAGLARALYPAMRAGRNAALFMLGRQRLRMNAPAESSAFAIFSHAFGMYAFADLLYAIYGGTREQLLFGLVSVFGAMGLYLLVRPRSPRVFAVLAASMLVAVIARIPVQSNHAILALFSLTAMAVGAAYTWLRGRSWIEFMRAFSPVGRALLLTMYFFGVFHKINTGFLDPEFSCAVDLWKAMPGPLPLLDSLWWRYTMIYGTLAGEAAILLGLLFHRTRYAAVMLGISFHSMLALSNYGFYLAFSTLTIALHLLFLSPDACQRITQAPSWRLLQSRMHSASGNLAGVFWAAALIALAEIGHFTSVTLLWLPWAIWLICLVGKHGRERIGETTTGPAIWTKTWAINVLSVAFFLNCSMPFLGLKNAQAMNMFANTTYESGRSTHLFLPATWPFGYLRDTVEILSVNGQPRVIDKREGRYTTFYDLLDQVDRNPSGRYTYTHAGAVYRDQTKETLKADLAELHPRWFRAWFHFRSFNSHDVQTCERGA